jgi:hypothetical protein
VLELGDTVIDGPDPTDVPPHVPLYHCHVAPVPKLPPLTVNVVLADGQMVVTPVIADGAVLKVSTVTVTAVLVEDVQPE